MSRVHSLLRADEKVVFRNSPGPVWFGLPLAGLCLAGLGWLGYALYLGEVGAGDWTTSLVLLPLITLFFFWYAHRPDVLVTDSRLLRTAGLFRCKAEAIAREDIAEVRFRGWRTEILARAPGLLRRTEPNGMAVADGRVWFGLAGLGWWRRRRDAGRSERRAFAAAVGLPPLQWRPPSLPEPAARLAAVEFLAGIGSVALWAAVSWTALSLWAGEWAVSQPLREPVFWAFWPLMLAGLWLVDGARRYLVLMLAPWLASAGMARIWLCAAWRPDWRGEHPGAAPASRAARLARYEGLLSRRYGEPVRCADLGGPETLNGGWVGQIH